MSGVAVLSDGPSTDGAFLRGTGPATLPAWSALRLPNEAAAGSLLVATDRNVMSALPGVAAGSILVSGGVGIPPAWAASPTLTFTSLTLTSLVVGGLVAPAGVEGYFASTSAADPRGIMSAQYSTDVVGARVHLRKGRGTEALPSTIVTGDTLGRIRFSGYDSANYLQSGSIEVVSTGTIAATRVPAYMTFLVATDAAPSVLTEVLRLTPTLVTVTGGLTVTGAITGAAAAGTLSGTTLAATVVTSSLTSVGTLGNLTVTNPITGSVTGAAGSVAASALTGATLAAGVTASSLTTVGSMTTLRTAVAGVNGAPNASAALTVGAALSQPSSAATSRAIYNVTTMPAATTTTAYGYQDALATAAAAFTLTDLYHYYVSDVVIGAGSAVTNQWGIRIDPLANAGSNYGLLVGKASSQTVWIANTTSDTTIAGGIAFAINRDVNLYRAGTGQLNLTTAAAAAGVGLDFATDATLKIRTRAQTGDAHLAAASVRGNVVAFASVPATPVEGMLVAVSDSSTAVWGATITGGGANHVLAYYNGTNWTVAGK